MIYCVSDIHGDYEKFKKMLEKLNLTDEDTLYVLGDICDRGSQPMEILLDMMQYWNIVPIVGNHDYLAAFCLQWANKVITDEFCDSLDDGVIEIIKLWLSDGGQTTFDNFCRLSEIERNNILEYFKEFSLYEEVTVNDQKYLLVHAGLKNFSPQKEIKDYGLADFIEGRVDYSKKYFDGIILVTGHTPTELISGNPNPGYIYKANNHIAIDCGCGFGGRLGILCLDTGEEIYIE